MNILIIGGGGREHALAWKIKQSPKCDLLFIAPGNAGTATLGENVSIDLKNNDAVVTFAREKNIELVVVAPDDYLAQGMVDALSEAGIKAFGPTKAGAKLEWSKGFAKDFMKTHNIPCAESETFTDYERALLFGTELIRKNGKAVIKADGLALGKGVVIADSEDDIAFTLNAFMKEAQFGESGKTVVIEEFLEGTEVSIHAFSDGNSVKMFPVARDHKRVGDGNTGPNTGGMGTIAPVTVPSDFLRQIEERVVMPVIQGMKEAGVPFKGVLFPGIMMTKSGPKVLEFNARFGDPECESYMRLLESDLVEILLSCIEGNLLETNVAWSNEYVATVMMTSEGYPGNYEKGKLISGIEDAEAQSGVVVFHAGTRSEGEDCVTNGGRVLGVSAVGESMEGARARAYDAVKKITFDGVQYRTDIGSDSNL